MTARYKMIHGGMQHRFFQCRTEIQIVGGGFGNGKTAACCVRALNLARDYPGSNGLIARSTYPKLNDTIRKEFFKWCDPKWIKRRPTQDDNTAILTNGSVINFRYVGQRGGDGENKTSNLLSATYDWIIVDQMEDPEFTHKDFMDLMGRLRGTTAYEGDDPTMPRIGPQWFMVTLNPTRNWCYRELIKPIHDFNKGILNPQLLVKKHKGEVVLEDGKPVPIVSLFEGSTYENVDNVGQAYIDRMETTFTGSMGRRFIHGEWGALQGLIYPAFDESIHVLMAEQVEEYVYQMRISGFEPTWFEGYDHGLARPSCYGLFFADDVGNVFLVDGFEIAELPIAQAAKIIHETRAKWKVKDAAPIYADPDVFRRKTGSAQTVGVSVAELFTEQKITLRRGNNDINAGISKNWEYLACLPRHEHPIYESRNSPHFYVSREAQFFIDEITEYYFKRDTSDEMTDKPTDRNDHAMDMWKYAMTGRPKLAKYVGKPNEPAPWMYWHEAEAQKTMKLARHK